MIARLIVLDLLTNARVWAGLIATSAAGALALALAAGFIESGIRAGGLVALAVYAVGGIVVILAITAVVVVISSTADLTVRLQRRGHARWQIVGLLPSEVQRIVLTQTTLSAILGATGGTVASISVLGPVLDFTLEGANGLEALRPRSSPAALGTAFVLVVLLALLASARASRLASTASPLELLDTDTAPSHRTGRTRKFRSAALALTAIALGTAVARTPLDRLELPLVVAGVLLTTAFTTLGPSAFIPLLAAWTRIVPLQHAPSWSLARANSIDNAARQNATLGPLLLAIALPAMLFTLDATIRPPSHSSGGGLRPEAVALLIGAPVLLALIGAAASVFMSGGTRTRESALLRAAGATPVAIMRISIAEATITVGTAAIAALLITAIVASWASILAGTPAPAPALVRALGPAGAVSTIAWMLMTLATTAPTLVTLRRPTPELLASA